MLGFIFIIIVLLCLIEKYSIDNAMSQVTYDIELSKSFLNPDEPFTILTKIGNGKWMTVPYLHVAESMPPDIEIHGNGYKLKEGLVAMNKAQKNFQLRDFGEISRTLFYVTYLKSRSILHRSVTASMPKRGRFYFAGADFTGGDFCGFSSTHKNFPLQKEIIVLPRLKPMGQITDAVGGFLGDVSVNRFIMEDPILTLGYGEYTGREPQRAISWTQSAKMNRMMVKKYDYTLEPCLMVLLNVQGGTPEQLEECFSITRTLCEELENRGIRYSYLANAIGNDQAGIRNLVPEGLGESHLYGILESLGRAGYNRAESFAHMLERSFQFAESGCSLLLVTPHTTPEQEEDLRRFSAMKGGKIMIHTPEEVQGWIL